MLPRLINLLFLAGIITGLWRVTFATLESAELKAEFDMLTAAVGHLNIEDESRIYVRVLENRPGHLAWRVYVPEGVKLGYRYQLGSAFGRTKGRRSSEPREVIFRWDFRSTENGYIEKTSLAGSGQGSSGRSGRPVLGLLLENWDKLDIRLAGVEETASFDRTDILSLVEIRLPESITLPTHLAPIVPAEMFLRVGDSTTEAWQDMVFEIEERRAQRLQPYSSELVP